MSMNPKKDADRAESRRGGGYGDGNAASPRTGQQVFQSKEATTNAYPTRAAANIRHGAGEVAGAGELNSPGAGPGRAAQGYAGISDRPMMSASGGSPKGMKTSQANE